MDVKKILNIPVFIHIGYHKTGTSWLQQNIFKDNEQIIYFSAYEIRDLLLYPSELSFEPEVVVNKIASDIDDIDGKIIVLSAEAYSGNPHTFGNGGYAQKCNADRLYRVFKDFDNVNIICAIRNQVDMVASVYSQYVKKGGLLPFRKYIAFNTNHLFKRPGFSFEHFDYDNLIDYYTTLFEDKVFCFLYEDFKADSTEYIKVIEQILGVSVGSNTGSRRINVGLPMVLIHIQRFINRISRLGPFNHEILINIPYLSKLTRNTFMYISKLLKISSYRVPNKYISNIKSYYSKTNLRLVKYFPKDKLIKYGYIEDENG